MCSAQSINNNPLKLDTTIRSSGTSTGTSVAVVLRYRVVSHFASWMWGNIYIDLVMHWSLNPESPDTRDLLMLFQLL